MPRTKDTRTSDGEGSIYKVKTGQKAGKWRAQVTLPNGKRKSFYGDSRADVKEKMDMLKDELAKGIDTENQATFGSWINTWMSEYKKVDLRLSTWENYKRSIDNHIKPALEDIKLRELKTDHIQALYNKMKKAGSSAATIKRNHQIIHGCLEQAVQNKLISWNPSKATKLPKLEQKKVRAMTNEEMDKFIKLLGEDRWGVAFHCLLLTGLRTGEILALRWKDIDLDAGTIEVNQGLARTKEKGIVFEGAKTENSKRIVPLTKLLIEKFKKHKTKQKELRLSAGEKWVGNKYGNLVFTCKNGTPIYPRNFQRCFYSIREKAGIPTDITVHGLRHTFATRLLEEKENLKTVQELLGHKDITTTANIYSHVSQEVKKDAVDKLDKLFQQKK